MPIVESVIQSQISALVDQLQTGNPTEKSPSVTRDEFVQGLTNIIVNAIRSADVTIPIGFVSTGASPSVIPNPAPIVIPTALS